MRIIMSGIQILLFCFIVTTQSVNANDNLWTYRDWTVSSTGNNIRYVTNGNSVKGHKFGFIKSATKCDTDLLWMTWSTYKKGIENIQGSDATIQFKTGDTEFRINVDIILVKNFTPTLQVIAFSNFIASDKFISLLKKEQMARVTIIAPEELITKLDITTDTFSLDGFMASMLKANEFCKGSNQPLYKVTEKNGDIYYKTENNETQLTHTGLNKGPVIHPSGAWIYYIKTTGANESNGDLGSVDPPIGYKGSYVLKEEIWKMDITGESKSFVYKSKGPLQPNQTWYTLSSINNIQFSPNGNKIYFETNKWATSNAIYMMRDDGSNVQMLGPGNNLGVIKSNNFNKNEYIGCLVVNQHRYFQFAGSYDWYWLFDSDFKEIGPIGDNIPEDLCLMNPAIWEPVPDQGMIQNDKLIEDKTTQLDTSEWSINESEGKVNPLFGNITDRDNLPKKISDTLLGVFAYLYPTRYGDHPRIGLSFRTIGGEGVYQFSGDEIHNFPERKKTLLKHIRMRPMKVNDKWVKMDVYGALSDTTGTIYSPYTTGDLNKLLCIFINSNEVKFNGGTFTTKGFTETFRKYNQMLDYETIMIEFCKDPSGKSWLLPKIKK